MPHEVTCRKLVGSSDIVAFAAIFQALDPRLVCAAPLLPKRCMHYTSVEGSVKLDVIESVLSKEPKNRFSDLKNPLNDTLFTIIPPQLTIIHRPLARPTLYALHTVLSNFWKSPFESTNPINRISS